MFLSFCMGFIEVRLNLQEEVVSDATQTLWAGVFVLLSIFWAYYDAEREDFDKPFDFGFLVYVFWPVAFPWYLIKTRGTEGVLVLIGFITLWLGPWFAGLLAYVYS